MPDNANPRPYSPTDLRLTFVASCIEGAADYMSIDYHEAFRRMKRVGMIGGYIDKCRDALHTQSRETVTADIVQCLKQWEGSQCH